MLEIFVTIDSSIDINVKLWDAPLADFKISLLFFWQLWSILSNNVSLLFTILYSCDLIKNGGIAKISPCIKSEIFEKCNGRSLYNPVYHCRWMNPIFSTGYKRKLEIEDMFNVTNEDASEDLGKRLERYRSASKSKRFQ